MHWKRLLLWLLIAWMVRPLIMPGTAGFAAGLGAIAVVMLVGYLIHNRVRPVND